MAASSPKHRRRLWIPSRPAIIVPSRRNLPDARRRIIPARAAVAFDTSGFHNSASASVSTLSNNFTIGSSLTNGAMVGFLGVLSASQITGATMTWNAVSMGAIASTTIFDAGGGSLALFGLVNPAGGTHSLSASWTNAGPATIGFWSFSGVDQTGGTTTFLHGNTATNSGLTTSQTLSITTANGNGTVAGWGVGQAYSGTQTPTADWQDSSAGNIFTEGQHILSSGATASFTAAISATDAIVGCGCDINAASGAAPTFVPYNNYFAPMLASKRNSNVGWREGYDHRWRKWRRERGLIVSKKGLIRAA